MAFSAMVFLFYKLIKRVFERFRCPLIIERSEKMFYALEKDYLRSSRICVLWMLKLVKERGLSAEGIIKGSEPTGEISIYRDIPSANKLGFHLYIGNYYVLVVRNSLTDKLSQSYNILLSQNRKAALDMFKVLKGAEAPLTQLITANDYAFGRKHNLEYRWKRNKDGQMRHLYIRGTGLMGMPWCHLFRAVLDNLEYAKEISQKIDNIILNAGIDVDPKYLKKYIGR